MAIEIKIDVDKLPPVPGIWPPVAIEGQGVGFVYALETFVQDTLTAGFNELLTAYSGLMTAWGWERVFLSSEVTGNPRKLAQLWRVPAPFPGNEPAAGDAQAEQVEFGRLRKVRQFLTEVSSFDRRVFSPLPYDPQPDSRPSLAKKDILLVVQACVKEGAMARLVELKRIHFKPTVEEPLPESPGKDGGPGWKLVAAGNVVSNSLPSSTIVQVWKLPNCNSLPETMGMMGGNGNYKELVAPCLTQETQLLHSVITANA